MPDTFSSYSKVPNGVEFNVSAPGKVILHGEHSVVYGKPALAASIDLRTKIHVLEIDSPDTFVFKVPPLNLNITLSIQELETQLLCQPMNALGDPSNFDWLAASSIHHREHLNMVEKALDVLKSSNRNIENGMKPVKCLLYLLSGIIFSTNVKLTPLSITVESELEMGAGVGSSASFCVTLAATLIHYLKLKSIDLKTISKNGFKSFAWTTEEKQNTKEFSDRQLRAISNWAFCGEKIFHGTPSGVDNTICTFGHMVLFQKNTRCDLLKQSNVTLDLLLINTGVSRETSTLVSRVFKLREKFPSLVNHILDAMEDLTNRAVGIISEMQSATEDAEHFRDLVTLVQINHGLLCALGVSHPSLEEIVMILETFGIKGKLTGAGGGGFAIALIPPDCQQLEEVISKLKQRGFNVSRTKLGGKGVLLY